MQSSPEVSFPLGDERENGPSPHDADWRRQRTADRVYQCLTLAAMLWVLASLWIF